MNLILLSARLAIACVFGVAGLTKLADRVGTRRSLQEFGAPAILSSPLAILLPSAELVGAVALVRGAWAWWGASGVLVLLGLFSVAIAINLVRGRTPDCHCFGQLHSEPVGWTTIARNVALASVAGFVVVQGPGHTGPGPVGWLTGLSRVDSMLLGLSFALTALAAFGLMMLFHVLAQNGRLLLRLEAVEAKLGGREEPAPPPGLPVNSEAPGFSLAGLDGMVVTLDMLGELGKSLLLVFTEPGCNACEGLLADVTQWQREYADRLIVVLISRGDVQVNRAKGKRFNLEHMLLQADREVAQAYKVEATPGAVLLKDGLIASPLATGIEAIRSLVFDATLPPPVKKGERAPALRLPDLDGEVVDIGAFRGGRTLVLFWNPACGFCQAMLNDLKSWERTRPKKAPELVVVAAGSPEANREQRFRSRVLLDPAFGGGRVFGATATPSAILLDEEGSVSSDVVVGAEAVLALAGAVPAREAVTA